MIWPPALTLALAVPLAWAIDARFGEPRDAWHPVAWLGRALAPVGGSLRAFSPAPAFVAGGLVWLVGAAAIAWLAWAAQATLIDASPWIAVPVLALLLKPTFAWRMLRDEASAVEMALGEGVEAARVSGWSMGAMALRLGVRLRKPGVYELNGAAPSPQSEHVQRALVLAERVAGGTALIVTAVWLVRAA